MITHMSTSIEGLLRNFARKKITFLQHDDGRFMTDKEARAELKAMLARGERLIKSEGCTKFDPVKGCLGHTEEEIRQEKIAALKEKLDELEKGGIES